MRWALLFSLLLCLGAEACHRFWRRNQMRRIKKPKRLTFRQQINRPLKPAMVKEVDNLTVAFAKLSISTAPPRRDPQAILGAVQAAQWCREKILLPFIKDHEERFSSFTLDWIDIVQDAELRKRLTQNDLNLLDKCARMVGIRNHFMHGDTLLAYLHKPVEMRQVLQGYLPHKVMSKLPDLLSFRPKSKLLPYAQQAKDVNALVAILALHRLCEHLDPIPEHLESTCAQIRHYRRPLAHPPVVGQRKALRHLANLLDE